MLVKGKMKNKIDQQIELLEKQYDLFNKTANDNKDKSIIYVTYSSECRQIRRLIDVIKIINEK